MCSAHPLMVFNVCVNFHENMSSSLKVMEQTKKLLTDTHTQRKDKNIIPPWHTEYFVCRGYKYRLSMLLDYKRLEHLNRFPYIRF